MSEVNIPLLRKEVEWVEAEAAKPAGELVWWYQDLYVVNLEERVELDNGRTYCGTAYCVAGHVGQQFDDRFLRASAAEVTSVDDHLFEYLCEEQQEDVRKGDGALLHVSTFARQKLGLPYMAAERLFEGGNSAERIRELAEKYAGEKL